jgi:AcrR family transcriptional regulator
MAPRGRAPSVLRERNGAGSPELRQDRDGAKPSPSRGGREQLLEIQRGRMIGAMIDVAAEEGASKVSVAAVVARSGVSRRTFYEVFNDAQECLLAALEDSLQRARVYVMEAHVQRDPWRVRTRATLHALLGFLEDEPARGQLLVIEAQGAGRVVLERRAQVLGELIDAVDEGRAESGRTAALTPLTAEGLVGSVLAVVHARMVSGGTPALVELTNPLMSTIVLPYLGPAAARQELKRRLPARRRRRRGAEDGASQLNGLPMRITYRTVRVLSVIAAKPGSSNRQVATAADIADQGQVSKLLQRLERLGLIVNAWAGQERGMANQWQLTPVGEEIARATGSSWEAGP